MSSPHQRSSSAATAPEGTAERLVKALEAMASAGLWAALQSAAGHVSPDALDEGQRQRVLGALERYVAITQSGAAAILGARLLRAAEALLDAGLPEVALPVLDVLAARGVTTRQAQKLARLQRRRALWRTGTRPLPAI